MMAEDDMLTMVEAARLIGVDPSTVRKLCQRGELACEVIPLGTERKLYRVTRAAAEAYRDRPPPPRGWPRGQGRTPRETQ